MEEQGINPSAANPVIQTMFNSVLAMSKAYHLVTAEHGSLNQDTTEFLGWVMTIVELRDQVGASSEWDEMSDLAGKQVYSAIYEPHTDIGIQIRLLEFGVHPLLPGSGPEVYWEYLIQPSAAMTGRNLERERFGFNHLVLGWREAKVLDEEPPIDFGTYLADIGYVPPGVD